MSWRYVGYGVVTLCSVVFLLGGYCELMDLWGGYFCKTNPTRLFRFDAAFTVYFTSLTWGCLSVLTACGLCVLLFVGHYFGASSQGDSLSSLLILFLGVMSCLFASGSWVWALLFWEYLGLASVFLILFSLSSSSLRGALVTLIVSRFGDAAFFVVVGASYWGFFGWGVSYTSAMLLLLIVTKSAFFPFTSWLPEAMRAPTPVSSLVHSSTLVAAGLWFLYRYAGILTASAWYVLFGLAVTTIVASGFFAMVFDDVKKLVALSTCNNVAWCVVVFIFGGLDAAIAQLVVHGVCKCALFIMLGDIIISSSGSQSASNLFSTPHWNSFFVRWCFFPVVFCLCGFPFLGLFFSKHVIFAGLLAGGMLRQVVVLLFCLVITSVYSLRFLIVLLARAGLIKQSYVGFFLGVTLYGVLGTLMGIVFSWVVSSSEPDFYWGLLVVLLQMLGCLAGFLLGKNEIFYPSGAASLNHSDNMINRCYLGFLLFSDFVIFLVSRWENLVLGSILSAVSAGRFELQASGRVVFLGGSCLVIVFLLLGR